MNELRALLAGMRHAEQGSDFVHCRGVLADWLEERGDERGARLRDAVTVQVQVGAMCYTVKIHDATSTVQVRLPFESTARLVPEEVVKQALDLFPEVCICERQVRVEVSKRELSLDGGRHHEGRVIRLVEEMLTKQGYDRKKPTISWDDHENRRIIIVQHCDELCPEGRSQAAWLKTPAGKMVEWSWPLARLAAANAWR